MPNKPFYTYVHRRADDGRVFYVGKGRGRRAHRDVGRSSWWRAVADKHGFVVEIVAEWNSEADAFEHEKFLIACFRDIGAPLCNLTAGGDGASGHKKSPETRAKIGAKHRGKYVSDETRARMAAARRGTRLTEEHRRKLSEAGRRRKDSAETIAKRVASQYSKRPKYTADGLTLTSGEWAARLGVCVSTIRYRSEKGLAPFDRKEQ